MSNLYLNDIVPNTGLLLSHKDTFQIKKKMAGCSLLLKRRKIFSEIRPTFLMH